ncbi:MAG: NADH-quinone oxidoreductase subunit NuoG [Alphaproteobacteria bacterium]|nr:NADH-quinone oxidoreductase subunit NuoG [Alphaproteobacteria bacterium]
MIKLTIDAREIEVEEGTSILQACTQNDIEIPRFCYHEKLSIAGSCRMCLVEVEKMPKLVISCAMPCAAGMVVHTQNDRIKRARAEVMAMLLLNHPLDCPVCDRGGACDLQDLAFAYGWDRSCSKEERRQVCDKELGPLIKTVMTRCIHCTRCLRFMDEIAGVPSLGGLYRGEDLEITPVSEGPILSELAGNLIEICPVGALTAKPDAFAFRPWELEKTDSIDVMDAVGSNIRIDTRGNKVMRIVPRLHEGINETWINDKTRFACDGLNYQRLDRPYLRREGRLEAVSWDDALEVIAKKLHNLPPERLGAIAGDLADCESMFAMKAFLKALDTPNMDCRQDGALYDISARAGYVMNSRISGIEQADVILLVGTNPRFEASLVNARLRKRFLQGGVKIGLIGSPCNLTYPYEHVGYSAVTVRDLLEEKHPFADLLKGARRPMLILGAAAAARADGPALHTACCELAERFNLARDGFNGFNVLQSAASRVGGLDLGFVPQGKYGLACAGMRAAAQTGRLDVLYLLGADEMDMKYLGKAFVIYQGHHGDLGAQRADVVLPTPAYTEKDGHYVNTEGRPQRARRAVMPLGQAQEDWAVLVMLAQACGKSLPFENADQLRKAMIKAAPHLGALDEVPVNMWQRFGTGGSLSLQKMQNGPANFYMTDSICRASPTMAQCTREVWPLLQGEG